MASFPGSELPDPKFISRLPAENQTENWFQKEIFHVT